MLETLRLHRSQSMLDWFTQYKRHILIWSGFLALVPFINPLPESNTHPAIAVASVFLGHITVFYTVSIKIYPILINKKKYFYGAMMITLLGLLYVGVLHSLWSNLSLSFDYSHLRTFFSQYIYLLAAGAGYYAYRSSRWRAKRYEELMSNQLQMVKQHFALEQKQLKLEQELLSKQKSFLNSQYNEHTLFNFLNHLYYKVYRNNPEVGEAITVFSDFLSFSLGIQFDQAIPISREIEYIENYIVLQKHLKEGLAVRFVKNGEADDWQLFPFILFPLVENAFKHGITDDPSYPIEIYLNLNSRIDFRVHNQKREDTQLKSLGVGLKNVKRMLEVYYPKHHTFNIADDNKTFMAELSLEA